MKKWIIFPLLILIIMGFFLILPKKENLAKEKIQEYNSEISTFLEQLKNETFLEKGTISGTLRYIGAHNEPYETEIRYDFDMKRNDDQIITTLNTEQNSHSILCESELIELINALKKKENTENILEIKETKKKKDSVQMILNPEKINEAFQKNYRETTVSFKIKGIIPTIETVQFKFDNTLIEIENNIINIPQKKITITLLKNGYFLSNNDNFKIQKEQKADSNTFHIVKNDVALTIVTAKDEIKLSTSTKKDQFHSMDITIKNEIIEEEQKENGSIEQFPILKYIKALNILDWRENLE